MGDCRKNVLSALMQRGAGAMVNLNSTSVVAKLGDALAAQSGYVKQALYVGILVGLAVAFSVLVVCCLLRRKAKQIIRTNRKYTPYGEVDDDFGVGHGAPNVVSAVDEDDW
jgi:hypothetical protein